MRSRGWGRSDETKRRGNSALFCLGVPRLFLREQAHQLRKEGVRFLKFLQDGQYLCRVWQGKIFDGQWVLYGDLIEIRDHIATNTKGNL